VSLTGARTEPRLRRSSGINVDIFGFGRISDIMADGFGRRSSDENIDGLGVGVSLKVKLGFFLCNCDIVLKLLGSGCSLDFSLCKDGIGAKGG
jgi:hypothetical protein